MDKTFGEFQKLHQQRWIKIKNQYLQGKFNNFKLYNLNKNNITEVLKPELHNNSKIIIIYKNETAPLNYSIICFDNKIIFLDNEQNLFESFLKQYESLNKHSEKYNLNEILTSKNNFHEEIENFSKEFVSCNFNSKYKSKNKSNIQMKTLWSEIIYCICGFLIQTALINTKNDQNNNSNLDFNEMKLEISKKDECYAILRILGNGSDGYVYLIYFFRKDEIFALKSPCIEEVALTKRERDNYLKLNYPFMPKYYGHIQVNREYHLMHEYINGKTLDKYDFGSLNDNDSNNIIFELMLTTQRIHTKGYMYRDWRLQNIIINENNDITLIDFGRMIPQDSQEITLSLNFIINPPEFDSKQKISDKTDNYLLAFIIYLIQHRLTTSEIKNYQNFFNSIKLDEKEKKFYEPCFQKDPNKRASISEMIHLFYINYLSKNTTKGRKEQYLISLLEDNAKRSIQLIDYFTLGVFYESDDYVPRDIPKAVKYYTYAAEKGHLRSQYNLGEIYYNDKNTEKAMKYYQLAADKNHAKSLYMLGKIYYKDKNTSQNINYAIKYLNLAAKQNYHKAQYELGVIYYSGEVVSYDIKKAIDYFTSAAEQNNPKAQYYLGVIYSDKKNQEYYNIKRAVEYLTLAANQNIVSAQYNLGNIYSDSKNSQFNPSKALEFYLMAAEQNDRDSLFNLGRFYSANNTRYHDNKKAIEYFKKSAKLGVSDAWYSIGHIYEKHIKNYEKAMKYYKLCADQGNPSALYKLGIIFEKGDYVKGDIKTAIHYYEQASKLENSKAMYKLGSIYENGQHIKRNIDKAIHYYENASKLNNVNAQFNLGMIYNDQKKYNKFDIQKAIKFLTLAAKNNHTNAQYVLGTIYERSHYIANDIYKAITYYKRAADEGDHRDSQNNLGKIYYNGIGGISRNVKEALKYFTRAAKNKCPNAIYHLGKIYEEGKYGIIKNITKALDCFKQAAELNENNAQYHLGKIYKEGTYNLYNINLAIDFLTRSANQNNKEAQYQLGRLYELGKHVELDIHKAIMYYKSAADNRHILARFYLGCIYFEGRYVDQDYEKALYYFREASSGNTWAKNNFAVIYKVGKGIKANLIKSTVLFKEAIKQHDYVAGFNLAHSIYFYGIESIDEAIEYLKIATLQKIIYSLDLLCLALIKKYDSSNLDKFKPKFNEMRREEDDILFKNVKGNIEKKNLRNHSNFETLKNILKGINLVYYGNNIENLTEKKKMEVETHTIPALGNHFIQALQNKITNM